MTRISKIGKGVMALLPFYLFTFILLTAVSCSEDDDTQPEYPNWQSKNEAYWDSLYTATQQRISSGDTSWKIIKNYSLEDTLRNSANTDYIIVHVLNEGTGFGCPLYTDSVRISYTGRLLPSTSYPEGYVFNTTAPNNVSEESEGYADFKVSNNVDGFITALQYMHIGDKWEVYIPWTLGYGTDESSSTTIPTYSVLRFTIRLIAYSRPGNKLPDFSAKPRLEWITE